jgi:hypothetical protein
MAFSSREERVLTRVRAQLVEEDPLLVGRFDIFSRLATNEGPPPPEEL